ncbi:MAG TPA: VCBS repeat-containing protein [Thermosynechococcaceae cyanobacterium]
MDTVFDSNQFTQNVLTIPAGSQPFSRTSTDSLGSGDTDDYIRLELSQRSSLLLKLNPASNNAELALLDSSGDPVDGLLYNSTNPGSLADAIVTDTLNPGTYFIRVYAASSSVNTTYTLSVDTGTTGRSDLFWRYLGDPAGPNAGINTLWLLNGATYTSEAAIPAIRDINWRMQATGDFDGDGGPDYVWHNIANGDNTIWLFDANNNFKDAISLQKISDTNWQIGGAADFNRDGKVDILWRNGVSGDNVIWYMNGNTIVGTAEAPKLPDPNWKLVGIADFNTDGSPDLAWRNSVNGQNVAWFLNNSTYIGSDSLPQLPDTNWQLSGIGDFNADGKSDLAWRNYANGQTTAWFLNGTTYQGEASLGTIADTNWNLSAVVSASAVPIDLAGNTSPTAFDIGTLSSTGRLSDRIGGPSDPSDYYKFTTATTANLTLSLRGLTADATLELIGADGATVLSTSSTPGTADEVIRTTQPLAAGTYYARISSAAPTSTAYVLNGSLEVSRDIDLLPTPNLGGSNPPRFRLTTTNDTALPTQVSVNTQQTIKVRYDIRNNSLTAPATFDAGFYLSTDTTITTADKLLSTVPLTIQAGAATGERTINVNLPLKGDPFWVGDRTYYIGLIVDPDSKVVEVNENNNTVNASIRIRDTGDPDVVGGGLVVSPASATLGSTIQLTGTIRNIGSAPTTKNSNGDTLGVRFRLSRDNVIDSGDYIFSSYLTIPTIPGGGSVNFNSANLNPQQSPSAYFSSAFRLPTLAELQASSTYQGAGTRTYYIGVEVNPAGSTAVPSFVPETPQGRLNNINFDFNGNGSATDDAIAITITV